MILPVKTAMAAIVILSSCSPGADPIQEHLKEHRSILELRLKQWDEIQRKELPRLAKDQITSETTRIDFTPFFRGGLPDGVQTGVYADSSEVVTLVRLILHSGKLDSISDEEQVRFMRIVARLKYVLRLRMVESEDPKLDPNGTVIPGKIDAEAHLFRLESGDSLGGFRFSASSEAKGGTPSLEQEGRLLRNALRHAFLTAFRHHLPTAKPPFDH